MRGTKAEPCGPLPGISPRGNRKLWRARCRIKREHPGVVVVVSVQFSGSASVSADTPDGPVYKRVLRGSPAAEPDAG